MTLQKKLRLPWRRSSLHESYVIRSHDASMVAEFYDPDDATYAIVAVNAYESVQQIQDLIQNNAELFGAKAGDWLLPKMVETLSRWVTNNGGDTTSVERH